MTRAREGRRRDAIHQLGRGHGRSRQRRLSRVLFVTGSVYPEVERKLPQYPYKTPRVLFRNLGNRTFEELGSQAGEGVTDAHCSRGCAFGDFDNDGDLDVLIVNMNEPPSLLRNDMKARKLAESQARGSEVKPQRDRSASAGALWR